MKKYRSSLQRNIVVNAVDALLKITRDYDGTVISQETLNLICDRYCYVVDPPKEVGRDERYDG